MRLFGMYLPELLATHTNTRTYTHIELPDGEIMPSEYLNIFGTMNSLARIDPGFSRRHRSRRREGQRTASVTPSSCLWPSMQRLGADWTQASGRRPWVLSWQSPKPSYKDNLHVGGPSIKGTSKCPCAH
eukprot:355132-Chlamydomonas_euryale.AAC.1